MVDPPPPSMKYKEKPVKKVGGQEAEAFFKRFIWTFMADVYFHVWDE